MNNIKQTAAAKAIIILIFININIDVFAFGGKEPTVTPGNETAYIAPAQSAVPAHVPQAAAGASKAEQVMRALAQAYPNQIDRVEFRNGDWAVLLRGSWYYYSDGRLLTDGIINRKDLFDTHGFYEYPANLPAWRIPSAEEQALYRAMAAERNQSPIRRYPNFYDELWRARSQNESYERVKSMLFLGKSVNVHYMIMEKLALVEETIYTAARTDAQVQAWINGISEINGWQWRAIADTDSRSYHAYGLAVDIVPRTYGGKEAYWLWTQEHKPDFWNVPYGSRWHPPDAVIKAFEKYGFVWGGKWEFFDTMHFEYRPEILILAGMPPETKR